MKALASSSFQSAGQGQNAGAHSGLTHPAGGPQNPPASAPSGEAAGEAAQEGQAAVGSTRAHVAAHAVTDARPGMLTGTDGVDLCTPGSSGIRGPLVSRPVEGFDPLRAAGLGRYEIVDQNGVRVVQGLHGVNAAAAIAHLLNTELEDHGICLVHLQGRRLDGTCFGCEVGAVSSPFAVPR